MQSGKTVRNELMLLDCGVEEWTGRRNVLEVTETEIARRTLNSDQVMMIHSLSTSTRSTLQRRTSTTTYEVSVASRTLLRRSDRRSQGRPLSDTVASAFRAFRLNFDHKARHSRISLFVCLNLISWSNYRACAKQKRIVPCLGQYDLEENN